MAIRNRVFMVAMTLMVAATACGGGSGGAAQSKALTLYSGRSEQLVGPLITKFETQTGIDVQVRYGETAEVLALIGEEGERSPADVFWSQDAGALGAAEQENLLATLPQSVLDRVPETYRSKDARWVGVSGRVRVIAYNPDLVKEVDVPDSIAGLTDAKWKGKVGWAPTNGSFQIFVTAFRELKGDDAARAWLQAMKANGAKAFPNNDSIAEAVGKGEITLGLVNHYYPFEIREENPDAKIEDHFLAGGDVGGLVNVSGAGILATSKNRKNAERFVEFLLASEAQKYFVAETWEYPLVSGVDPDPRLPKLEAIEPPAIDLSKLADLDGTLKLLKEVDLL